MSEIIELPITRAEYDPNLCYLRKIISLDRSGTVSPVKILNGLDHAVTMFVRHHDVYAIGFDWGQGPYHFNDMEPFGDSRPLGFVSNYSKLNFQAGQRLMLSDHTIRDSIAQLSRHRAGHAKGANMFDAEKAALVRLLFVVPEALRFWHLQRDVMTLLKVPGEQIDISTYRGDGQPLNNWATLSADPEWPAHGIFLPHLPRTGPTSEGGKGRKR